MELSCVLAVDVMMPQPRMRLRAESPLHLHGSGRQQAKFRKTLGVLKENIRR
jgi:hypothetical protein